MRIAICEDNEGVLEIYGVLLSELGHDVEVFINPERVQHMEFDLVFSDYIFNSIPLDKLSYNIPKEKLVIITGSPAIVSIDCLFVVKKPITVEILKEVCDNFTFLCPRVI